MKPVNKELITKLRKNFGDAFYLLDSDQFRQNFLELKDAFSSIYHNFNIAYSYKTNYTPKLCKIVNELGGYAEVVSEMEVELALKCAVEPKRIIWNGPIKNKKSMAEFLNLGGTVNIDSIEEAEYIRDLAKNTDKQFNIGIRCNYDLNDGVISRFGFDVDGKDFMKAIEIVKNTDNLYLINLQCHFAKRQLDYWTDRAKKMVELLDRIGVIPERIDIGGGLFGKMEDSLKKQFDCAIPSYKDYAQVAATIFSNYFFDKEKKPEVVIEPGSAIVGDCMKFVGTVKTIKNVRGKWIASLLGSQKNISMSGVNPPIEVVHFNAGEKYENIDLVGYTCIEGDVLYKNYNGELAVNDAIIIGNCGSYSLVMKPPFILPNFPVIDICGNEIEVIKKAETFDDIFSTFKF